jgi:hypothetical protein
VLETSAEYLNGANNTKESKMSPLDLLKVNVNDHTEKKNGLTYLSWAWAWQEALKADPKANFKVEMFDGNPLMPIGGTFMVWVTVTMFDKPVTCMLPVLDYRNKPIATPNSFDVNTSIMRCLVKAIAMHGLGLYIYAGEDTPPDTEEVKPVTLMPIVDGLTAEMEVNTHNEDDNKKLFADSMIHYTNICHDIKGLNSYWKANQAQLDALKVSHPDLYSQVRNRFAEIKKQLSEKPSE